jgi:arginyl-tRNA synthetase
MKSPVQLRTELARRLDRSIKDIWGDSLPDGLHAEVSRSDNLEFGDLSCNTPMKLAGILRESPRRIAERILDNCRGDLPGISAVSVDGPGFINMTLSPGHLAEVCASLAVHGLKVHLPDTGQGRRALVEFVSSNPTGPLTVGHCRQAVLGDAISNLLEAVGWKVSREYYYNDGGRQMNLLGESLAVRYAGGDGSDIPEGGYRGDYLARWAGELRERIGDGLDWGRDRDSFIGFAEEKAMEMIRGDLALLGIEFDRYFSESELIPLGVEAAIDRLSAVEVHGGRLVYADPASPVKLWLRFTALGRPKDRVIRREDGSYTYRMPDIAYHMDKFRRGYDMIVDVFGADHLDTSRDVVAALEAIVGDREVSRRLRVVIHQFVTLLRGGERIKMSTRSGEYVTLAELVEEAGSADVTRYLFLTRRPDAHMDFDLDLARKESSENPVYYVQYAHARISGILRTAGGAGIGLPVEYTDGLAGLLSGDHERELMRLLESVPVEVASCAESMEPHKLTELLSVLATGFHRFYQHVRVVDVEDPAGSSARLMLCQACRQCIAGVLSVLGVSTPDRM